MNIKTPVITPIVKTITNLQITNAVDLTLAVTVLSKLNRELDRIVLDKEKLTKPIQESLKEIRSRYEPKITELKHAIAYTRQEMTNYQTREVLRAELEAEAIAERVGKTLNPETAMNKIAKINNPDKKVVTQDGSVSFRPIKRFELEDITKVPLAYLTLNEAPIKELMKDGIEVEGVKYWVEQVPVNRQ